MCHSLTPVVQHAPRRKVMRCSCGALHVVWDSLNLSLNDEEFRDLHALAQAPDGGSLGQWHAHHSAAHVGLWYGPLGTTLSLDDWQAFAALLQAAQVPASAPSRPLYALN
ncbi:hypothetical protein GO986_17475 [Deinococcus sp. HMF7620]|uniref:Uncharacterized protein n=1 Tax=Deinococcus arboris TaxID=2682977 RepID=A0A7C9HTH4_9DEIO|nr:hypothetical protein [Deinococcus arboris]MVN88532.1 hypothetical protein [Deinococcus arboris]